jgi:hypothetical protein
MAITGLSNRVRSLVASKYVLPAISAGNNRLSIKVRDLLNDTEMEDFPRGRTPIICQVLLGKKLLIQNHLEVVSVDGPPSKQSPTVVVHYRVTGSSTASGNTLGSAGDAMVKPKADPLLELSGVLRGAIQEGAAAFLRELRKDKPPSRARRSDQEKAA